MYRIYINMTKTSTSLVVIHIITTCARQTIQICADCAIKAQWEAILQMLQCEEEDSKWAAAWGKRPFTSSIQITFLKHVEEALAHPYHTHISTFANQMSRLEKAELS